MGKFDEHFKLNLKFMGSSKRLAIISIIGLSISIAMITQNVLFLTSFRNNAFDEFTSDTSDTYIDCEIENIRWAGVQLQNTLKSTVISQMQESEMDLNKLAGQEWFSFRFFYLLLYNELYETNEFHDTYVIGVDYSYLSLLGPLMTYGNAPNYGEYCFVTNTKTIQETNLALNDTYNVYIKLNDNNNPWESYSAGIGLAGQVISFSGIINIDEITYGSVPIPTQLQTLVSMALGLGKELIITDFNNLPSLLGLITRSNLEFSVLGRIIFNVQVFNVFKIDDEINALQSFVNKLQEALLDIAEVFSTNHKLIMNPRLLPLLSNFRREYRIFQIFLLIFMLPTLGMSLTLTSFATNQVKKHRELHVHTYHQRGSSRSMLFSFMLFELVIFALLATVIGYLIGWPYTLAAQRSDGFFSFQADATLFKPDSRIIIICLAIGFGVAFLSNIFSLWKKTKTSVDEVLQEQSEKKPFWERFYVDIFMLSIGLLMWIVSLTQISAATSTSLEFAFFFAAPAPILIIIGAIMVITRIYPAIINGLSSLMFKVKGFELSAVSSRNAIRRRGSTTRTIILMTLTFTLTVATMIVPDSYREFDYENSYYNLGADIVVQNVNVLTSEYKESLADIEGIEAASYVAILELTNSESDLLYSYTILGVELNNFSSVAFQEPEYTNGLGIEALLSSIENDTDVIAQADQIALLNLGSENTTFFIKNWALEGSDVVEKRYPVSIKDYYTFWPAIYTEMPNPSSKELKIGLISNITLPFIIARNNYDVEGKVYVKVKDGNSISDVASNIERFTQHQTINIEQLLLISEGTLKSTVLFGALNSSLIISILISSATLITMMIVQGMEREKEIALLKSFGINGRQLFSFFISEAIIILLFTMILGIGLGFGSSVMLMKILRIEVVLPTHEMVYPTIKIVWTTLAIFASGLLSTIIPIIINTRKKIGGALKAI
ncbi:MAG: FtsX-like permease family protein [Candidatus Heimdallarchaeota archaeon]|nr:FtsX-like permease family protein [Candidatus Heimdallarchaeota archaeon]